MEKKRKRLKSSVEKRQLQEGKVTKRTDKRKSKNEKE
jgi:hypothetical protein